MSSHQEYVQRASFELRNPTAEQLLVLLHGLGGDRNQPLRLVEGWQREDLAIVAPDLRAHGQTDRRRQLPVRQHGR
jgi:alpha-beta hydrolase superfamily lysophospholipase